MFKVGDLVKIKDHLMLRQLLDRRPQEDNLPLDLIRLLENPPLKIRNIANDGFLDFENNFESNPHYFLPSNFELWNTWKLNYKVGDLVRINHPNAPHLQNGAVLEIKKINSPDYYSLPYMVGDAGYYYSDKELELPGDFRVGDHVSSVTGTKEPIYNVGKIYGLNDGCSLVGITWKNSTSSTSKINLQHVSSDLCLTEDPNFDASKKVDSQPSKSEYVSLKVFREELNHTRKELANTRLGLEHLYEKYVDEIKKASQSREQLNKQLVDYESFNSQHREQKYALDEKLRLAKIELKDLQNKFEDLKKRSDLDLVEIELLKKKIPMKPELKPSVLSGLIRSGWNKTKFLGSSSCSKAYSCLAYSVHGVKNAVVSSREWLNDQWWAQDVELLVFETFLFINLLVIIDFGYINTVWFNEEYAANNVIGPQHIPSPNDPREAALIEKKAMLRKKMQETSWK